MAAKKQVAVLGTFGQNFEDGTSTGRGTVLGARPDYKDKDINNYLARISDPSRFDAALDEEEKRKKREEELRRSEQPNFFNDVRKTAGDVGTFLFGGVEKLGDVFDTVVGNRGRAESDIDEKEQLGVISREEAIRRRNELMQDYDWAGTKTDVGENLKKAAGVTLEAGADVLPIGAGALIKGGTMGAKLAKGAVAGAATAGVGSTGAQLAQEGTVDPLRTAGDVALGGALGAGGAYVGDKFRKFTQEVGNKVNASKGGNTIFEANLDVDDVPLRQMSSTNKNAFQRLDEMVGRGISRLASNTGDVLTNTRAGNALISGKDKFAKAFISEYSPIYKLARKGELKGYLTPGTRDLIEDDIAKMKRSAGEAEAYWNENANIQNMNNIIKTLNPNSNRAIDLFNDYAAKRRELSLLEQGRKEYDTDGTRQAQLTEELATADPKMAEAYDNFTGFFKEVAQMKLDTGQISKDEFDAFMADPDYIRIQRELPSWRLKRGVKGGNGGGLSTSKDKQKMNAYANQKIINPLEVGREYLEDAFLRGSKLKAEHSILDMLERAGVGEKLVDADMVNVRKEMRQLLSDTRPLKNEVDRLLRTRGRQLRSLASELNQLNIKGLNLALGKERTDVDAPILSGIRTNVTQAQKASKRLDELNEQGLQQALSQDRATPDAPILSGVRIKLANPNAMNSPMRDVPTLAGTEATDQFSRSLTSGETRSLVKGMVQEDSTDLRKTRRGIEREQAKLEGATQEFSRSLTAKETRDLVGALVEMDPAELTRVRKMIATREPKYDELFDEVQELKDQAEGVAMVRGKAWKEIQANKDRSTRGKSVVHTLRNGVQESYQVPEDVYAAMTKLDESQRGFFEAAANNITQAFKVGTTSGNPAFTIPNYIRDQAASFINSENPFATHNPVNVLKGLYAATKSEIFGADPKGLYAEYKKYNSNSRFIDVNRDIRTASEKVRQSLGQSKTLGEKVAGAAAGGATPIKSTRQGAKALWDKTQNVVGATEDAVRYQNWVGTYKKFLKQTGNEQEAIQRANRAARRNSTDFLERGDFGRTLNAIQPYFNASVQGTRALGRAMRDRPIETSLKIGATLVTPTVISTMYNLSDPDRADVYAAIPEHVRRGNFVIVTPGAYVDENNKTHGVMTIPKPAGLDKIVDPVRDIVEFTYMGDPVNFLDAAKTMISGVSPVDIESKNAALNTVTPQMVKPFVENWANENMFTGAPVVPEALADLPNREQYTEDTPQVIKDLAGVFGASPLQVQNVLRGLFGEAGGKIAPQTVDAALGGGNVAEPLAEGITRRFSDPKASNFTTAFYNQYDKVVPEVNLRNKKVTAAANEGDFNRAQRLARETNEYIDEQFKSFYGTYGKFFDTDEERAQFDEAVEQMKVSEDMRYIKRRAKD